jgi:hypothetical protein
VGNFSAQAQGADANLGSFDRDGGLKSQGLWFIGVKHTVVNRAGRFCWGVSCVRCGYEQVSCHASKEEDDKQSQDDPS